ncbi:MAG: sulfite exporter TauE/SafE family protein [Sulfuricurvum sp.]|uniref:sulfite exporter TauE/SafE family protein n=1 Tax=Sulfuricurvum sp. TaxID=2025608 RepID=UPI00260C105B|nr:sulfite exporter TauE/SafE family protein [Sulfuricurvum sp.]MDD3598008.1 sulfite exporter TauE/SafE family protein [Sulfuricurvum sp.]
MILDLQTIILLITLGAFVGVAAGLLGIGGGGIIVPALTAIFLMQGMAQSEVVHMALGTSMATIVVTSFSSLRAHHKRQGVLWDVVKMMAPGIVIGTFLATFLASVLSSLYLAVFFSIFMAYVSLQMFIDKKPKPSRTLLNPAGQFASGSVIGAVSAMVSIGGGSLTVPYLVWQNVELKKAIGTSAAVGFPIAISGTLGYVINGWHNTNLDHLTVGFVSLPAFFVIALFSYFTAPIGVKLAHVLPVGTIKKIFAFLLIALSVKMLSSFI